MFVCYTRQVFGKKEVSSWLDKDESKSEKLIAIRLEADKAVILDLGLGFGFGLVRI